MFCPDTEGQKGTSLLLLPNERGFKETTESMTYSFGTTWHRDNRIPSRSFKGEILWPDVGVLADLGLGYISRGYRARWMDKE